MNNVSHPDASTQHVVQSQVEVSRIHQSTSTSEILPDNGRRKYGWPEVFMGIFLVVFLAVLAGLGKNAFEEYGENYSHQNAVSWDYPALAPLEPGPSSFTGDKTHKVLLFRGAIDDKTKTELLALFPADARGKYFDINDPDASNNNCDAKQAKDASCKNAEATYREAIDMLAYKSNSTRFATLISLLWVAAIFGSLGSHVRSMAAFVNHMGNNHLNLHNWWPYYIVRPLYGAVFGMLVFVIIKGGFLTTSNNISDPTLWWMSLAFFAGFGDREFAEKLRQIIKALFGESSEGVKKVSKTEKATVTDTTTGSAPNPATR